MRKLLNLASCSLAVFIFFVWGEIIPVRSDGDFYRDPEAVELRDRGFHCIFDVGDASAECGPRTVD